MIPDDPENKVLNNFKTFRHNISNNYRKQKYKLHLRGTFPQNKEGNAIKVINLPDVYRFLNLMNHIKYNHRKSHGTQEKIKIGGGL